jgi:uncharacterized RDD family membrane protein YckC
MNDTGRAAGVEVRSVTGVDFTLPIAGPGGRAYAFIIDWHIRTLAALAWLGMALLAARFEVLPLGGRTGMFVVALPAAALYFLYHPVIELVMEGLTPGKRMAGVRIVMNDGSPPGVGALLLRNAFRLVDALPAFYAVGLVAVFATRMNTRIGDLAAGTLLIYDETLTRRTFASLKLGRTGDGLTTAQAELVDDLLQRWPELDSARRTRLATTLLRRLDPDFPAGTTMSADEEALLRRLRALVAPPA